MAKITYYPLGNADCCVIRLDNGKLFVFDYADMHNPDNDDDRRMPLKENFRQDIGWPSQKTVDVFAVTHGDNDHLCKSPEQFWLDHAEKYQGADRVKIKELWVPAALIVEEGSEDDTRIIRTEARYRFLQKQGIKVFARPAALKAWLEERGLRLEDFQHLIVDAGKTVPGLTLENDGVEFFVHSPFAERTEEAVEDRNSNCLVMQATIRSGGHDTRFLITADSVAENWQRMVRITRAHGNDLRLAWDVLKIPHHCSYLSMAEDKGDWKTTPTPEFEWFLEQGTERAVIISTSDSIPSGTTDQPPHVETFRRYKETADALDADLVVTMENPNKLQPKRTVITLDCNGPTLEKKSITASVAITSTKAPRVG